jgi:hypothetical protein
MTTSGTMRLPQSPRAAVFRVIVAQLQDDATLKPRGIKWRVWDGNRNDALPWTHALCPGCRLTPISEESRFYSPDGFLSNLTLQVELAVASLHLDDAENLFWAFVRALYPDAREDRLTLQQARRDVGAQSGLIQFSGLSYDPLTDLNPPLLIVSFTMMIAVAATMNP